MPVQKILLKVIALSIFAIFIASFIKYYNKPAGGKAVMAFNFSSDTVGKPIVDSFDTVRVYLPSSKSTILSKSSIILLPRFKGQNGRRRAGTDSSIKIAKDTAKKAH